MSSDLRRVPLTEGNVRNGHFYLRECRDLLPTDCIGGGSKAELRRSVTVQFEPGPTVDTDVDGTKMLFRNRRAQREFLEASAAEAGDIVILERLDARTICVWLEKQGGS